MDKVSIIVPIYNVEQYIERCLDSILQQSYSQIELICVDDCGNDGSMQIVRDYSEKYPDKVKIICANKNQGLGAARDFGTQNATGEYVMYIDSDDYITKDYVEMFIKAAQKESFDLVIGGYIRDESGSFSKVQPSQDMNEAWMHCTACCKIYKRSFLEDNNLTFRGIRRYEDELFCYRVLLKKPKVCIINYAGYYYCLNRDSITQNKKVDRTEIFLQYILNIRTFLEEIYCEKVYENEDWKILQYCLVARLTACLLYNGRGCGTKKMMRLFNEYNAILNFLQKVDAVKIGFFKELSSEDFKMHYATWLVLKFRKFRMEKILFKIDSLI